MKDENENYKNLKQKLIICKKNYLSNLEKIEKYQIFSLDDSDEIVRSGLAKMIGIKIDGYGCFLARPEHWQNIVLKWFLVGSHMASFQPKKIRERLQEMGLVFPCFHYVNPKHEESLEGRRIGFKSPFGAICLYLDLLKKENILSKIGMNYIISASVNERLQNMRASDKRKQLAAEDIKRRALVLLDVVPEEEKAGFDLLDWFQSKLEVYGMSISEAVATDGYEIKRIMSAFSAIESMILSGGAIVEEMLGFPFQALRERLREKRRLESEEREAEQRRRDAERQLQVKVEREDRFREFRNYIHRVMPLDEAQSWLEMPSPQLNGQVPQIVAQESQEGLSSAWYAFETELKQREKESQKRQDIETYRQRLVRAAEQSLGVEKAAIFYRSQHPRLENICPFEYCVDEGTLNRCLLLLTGKPKRR